MREGALDILDRNRSTLLKSINDNIGKVDSAADFFLSAISAERLGYVLSEQDNSLIKMFYSIIKEDEMPLDSGSLSYGGQQIYGTAYDDTRVIPPVAGQSLAGTNVNMAQGDAKDPYKNHNFFDYRFNGLMRNSESGSPAMLDSISDFYLAPDVGADSRSHIDGEKEKAWEKYYGDDENYAFLFNEHHYGNLKNSNHDDYEENFGKWKLGRVNDEFALREQGLSDMEIEHELRKMHMEEAKQGWMSDGTTDSGIKQGLGLFDYLYGMEWKSPEQRAEVYEHMREHGLGNKYRRSIGTDNHTDVSRLVRNFHQRFAGMHDNWVRSPTQPGQPLRFIPQPIGKPSIRPQLNQDAIDHVDGYDKAVGWHASQQEEAPKSTKVSIDENGKLQFGSTGAMKKGLRRAELFRLMNINPATEELFRDGEHPDYEDWNSSESPFTQEDVNKVLKYLDDSNLSDDYGVMAENAGMVHFGHHIDPAHYPEEITQGEDSTLATHWNKPFLGGGMGKDANDLYNLIHQASLLYGPDKLSPFESKPEDTVALEGYEKIFSDMDAEEEKDEHERITRSPKGQQRSLNFDKFTDVNSIGIRHYLDRTTGDKLNSGMLPAWAPFGQPEQEVMQGSADEGQAARKYTVMRSVATDAESNLNPHNKWMGSKLGTRRKNWERHYGSVNPRVDNQHRQELFDAYGTPQWNAIHDKIRGRVPGTMSGHNPFMGKGGATNFQSAKRKMAHIYHRTGTMAHMEGSPFSLDNGIQELGRQAGSQPTAANLGAIHSLKRGREVGMGPIGGSSDSERGAAAKEEEINALFSRAQYIEGQLESATDDKSQKHFNHLLDEINSELNDLEMSSYEDIQGEGMDIGERDHQTHSPTEQAKFKADAHVIAQAGSQIQNTIMKNNPELWNNLFDETLPLELLDANKRMLARMSNDYLHIAPHDAHGLMTKGLDYHDVETKMVGQGTPNKVKTSVHGSKNKATINSSGEDIAEMLGLNYGDERQRATVDSYLEKLREKTDDPSLQFPVMTMEQLLSSTDHYGDLGQGLSSQANRIHTKRSFKTHQGVVNTVNRVRHELAPVTGKAGTSKTGTEEGMKALGLDYHAAHNPDPDSELTTSASTAGGADKFKSRRYRTLQGLNSILTSDPEIAPQDLDTVTANKLGLGDVKVDAFGPDAEGTVHSFYNSAGFMHEFGDQHHEGHVTPTFDYKIKRDGTFEIIHIPEGLPMNLVRPMSGFVDTALPHLSHIQRDAGRVAGLNTLGRQAPQFQVNEGGEIYQRKLDPMAVGKSEIGLADLTNPDILRKELGKEIPLLQPMHRIFKLEDLEHLRGFTGDWIVSVMPKGERGFIIKDDDKVTSPSFKLSDEDKENFKKVTDDDYHIDVIKTEEGYYIFDVIEFDGKEVHDTLLDDRIKILRGGMEGVQNIHVPSASDTRLTDDGGLKSTVDSLKEEHDTLLLRDAKSTYMVGELRQPKWVLLSEGKDVVLIVLERRGSGPYTYRLGTGPITQDDSLGARAVELNKETYMDVGAVFDSPEKFNEGDHVSVNVDNVGESEFSEGHKMYTVTGSEIQGEAEGEGLVSQETLGLLAKSESEQWLCEVSSVPSGIRIAMPQGDVIYKTTQSADIWTVHSPLADNSYLIRLSETQRRYWAPVVGTMLKAGLEITEKEEVHDDSYESSPTKPFIEPKKVKDTDWWKEDDNKKKVLVKGLQLVERMMKSGVGAVGTTSTGTMGLGIGYATPIESPSGPTNLHDEKTMPDYDNKKRPGEDSTIEPGTQDEEPAKDITIPVEEGELKITNDSAIFRTY